jgi:hypothetical protein
LDSAGLKECGGLLGACGILAGWGSAFVLKQKFSVLRKEGKEEKARSEPQKKVELASKEEEGRILHLVMTVVEEPEEAAIKEPKTAAPPPGQSFFPDQIPLLPVVLRKTELQTVRDAAKQAHAVATKADDAEIPSHLWDQQALWLPETTPPTEAQKNALNHLRR